VSYDGPTAAMETCFADAVQNCGTVFQLIWDKLTLTLNTLSGCQTFLFGCWDSGTLWLNVKLHLLRYLTYLLINTPILLYGMDRRTSKPTGLPISKAIQTWSIKAIKFDNLATNIKIRKIKNTVNLYDYHTQMLTHLLCLVATILCYHLCNLQQLLECRQHPLSLSHKHDISCYIHTDD